VCRTVASCPLLSESIVIALKSAKARFELTGDADNQLLFCNVSITSAFHVLIACRWGCYRCFHFQI